MSEKVQLLIIDPQHDFCDPSGTLFIPGAEEDIKIRLPSMIRRLKNKIGVIHVTLDCHRFLDVAHPRMWKDSTGKQPDPFTIISSQDIESGRWLPVMPNSTKGFLAYTKSLESSGRYPLCIWPPHCLLGSLGNTIVPELFETLKEWESENLSLVNYVTKGLNPYTEHYSAVKAEVPDPNDPSTHVNTKLIRTLMEAEVLAVAGEAGSHCLANTVKDMVNECGDFFSKMVLLTDATSPVPGFESLQDDFIKEMKSQGMKISNTYEFLR